MDWEAIEREYRAGQLSVAEIGRQHTISHVAILKRAKKKGWTRNLSARVREAVTARLVTDEVTGTESVTDAQEAVDLAASRGVAVVREHRGLLSRGKKLIAALFGELEEATEYREEIEVAIEDETASDKTAERRNRMLRAVALPTRSGTLLNLANASKAFIGLDRQAFGLTDDNGDKPQGVVVELVRFAE